MVSICFPVTFSAVEGSQSFFHSHVSKQISSAPTEAKSRPPLLTSRACSVSIFWKSHTESPCNTVHCLGEDIAISMDSWYSVDQWFSNISMYQIYLKCLLKHRLMGPSCRISDLLHLGQGSKFCASNKFLHGADTNSLGTTL